MKKQITKQEFINKIKAIHGPIHSVTERKQYTNIKCKDCCCRGLRKDRDSFFIIDTEVLYQAYKALNVIKPGILQKDVRFATNKHVSSPSCAILLAAGLIDKTGKRL